MAYTTNKSMLFITFLLIYSFFTGALQEETQVLSCKNYQSVNIGDVVWVSSENQVVIILY